MRYFLFTLLLIVHNLSFAQSSELCFVTSVKGQVFYHNSRKPVNTGDAMTSSEAKKNIDFLHPNDFITLYSPRSGSFKVSRAAPAQDTHFTNTRSPNLIHFAKELLRVQARTVPLSSRGDCDCVVPEECLTTDPKINHRLLFTDSLTFPVVGDMRADSSFYFLQYKANNTLVNHRLVTRNGIVVLRKSDLIVKHQDSVRLMDSTITLGLCRMVNGEKKLSVVTKMQLQIVDVSMLRQYFEMLRRAMPASTMQEVFETFCTDIYVYYGKPNFCSLKKLVMYEN